MERKEFEQVLKRALELKSLQKTQQDDSFAIEDLHSAAARLGIEPEVLEQAMRDTKKQFKKFHLSDSPDQVREAFLKHFLMNESHTGPGMAMVKIDHASISASSNAPIRVYHPHAKTIDAYVEFSTAPDGGTNITWSGNKELPTSTKALAGGWPLLLLIPMMISAAAKGMALITMLPIALIMVMTSMLMLWILKQNVSTLEASLENYFQNCQTLDEIEIQKNLKVELTQLREKAAAKPIMDDSILRAPMPELQEDDDEEQSDMPRTPDGRLKE
ncbi:MAG: hypothetical protein CVV41_21805 [Candidatus Riflebacteria bacterium HGW-Riflebacteria-1]|nr:MAG: hypothetical protein CVV41_21805 [Candidatus Riflebacteria bacterium HGW-Riflebacteria-1]